MAGVAVAATQAVIGGVGLDEADVSAACRLEASFSPSFQSPMSLPSTG
jgi:hypothetical protein